MMTDKSSEVYLAKMAFANGAIFIRYHHGSSEEESDHQVGVYHGTTKSQVFHGQGCQYYNCKNCTVMFNNHEEAVSNGYHPCGNCRP